MAGSVKVDIAIDLNEALLDLLDSFGVDVEDFLYTLDYIKNSGWPLDNAFGPLYGDSFDDPAVIGCCENGYTYPNTPTPAEPDAEHGWACGVDCLDQSCRAAVKQLTDFAEGDYTFLLKVEPRLCSVFADPPCYYDQLNSLANYVSNRHNDCVSAFYNELSPGPGYLFKYGGELDLDDFVVTNDDPVDDNYPQELWPSLSDIVISTECQIAEWELPPAPDSPQECTSSNDNNDEDPFGAIEGGGFPGVDSFVPTAGLIVLDGPTLMGIDADGSAPLKGFDTNDCKSELCSYVSVFVDHDEIRLASLVARAPEQLAFTEAGNTLSVHDLRITLDSSAEAPLVGTGGGEAFEFAPGELMFLASAKLYGVPIVLPISNASSITGSVHWASESIYSISMSPLVLEYDDPLGLHWMLQVDFGSLLPFQHAPRAAFTAVIVGNTMILDASTTTDGDGDLLSFVWMLDGQTAGTDRLLRVDYLPNTVHTVTLNVRDSSGRDSTMTKLFPVPPP